MVMTDCELQLTLQLKEAGKLLLNPLISFHELLHVLDQTEKLLSKVDQTPNNFMLEALYPSMRALVGRHLLEHSNMDVKVAVAACISEITRITAPDAPYSDEEMKDVMQLIVSSFEDLWDDSSKSYEKRASIVETVSKVRSCVIMLDLECNELIVRMFEHFLKSVRNHHLESVFSSMLNIMVIVLEESEEISVDMLKPLLASIKNEGVLQVARKLGEEVLRRSATKLRPYLVKTLSILGDSLDNYSPVLASICEGKLDVVKHNGDEGKLMKESLNKTPQVVVGKADRPSLGETDVTSNITLKLVVGNGITVTGSEKGSADKKSPKKSEEVINHRDANLTGMVVADDSSTEKLVKVESSSEHIFNRKGNKFDTTMESAKASDHPNAHGENEPSRESFTGAVAISSEKADIPVSVSKTIESDERFVKKDGSLKEQVLPQQEEAEAANAVDRSQSVPRSYKKRNKKAGWRRKKSLSRDGPSMDVVLTKVPEGMSDSDMKSAKRRRKKAPFAQEDKNPATDSTLEDGKAASGPEAEPLISCKKVDSIGSGSKPPERSAKKVGARLVAKKLEQAGKSLYSGDVGGKSDLKSSGKKTNKSSSLIVSPSMIKNGKRKRPGKTGKKKPKENNTKYDESLVGLKVKVWWPLDKMYYEGVIESFDSKNNMHEVLYLDGELENLNLRKERWEILQEFSAPVEEEASEAQSTDGIPDTPKKKNPRMDSGPSVSQKKMKDSAKQAGGDSVSGKSKSPASTPAISLKGEGKVDDKSEDNNLKDTSIRYKSNKNIGKSVLAANSKDAGVSKEDDEETPELITKSKQGTRRKVYKSVKAANSKDAGVSKEDDEETPELITQSKQGTRRKVYKSVKAANSKDAGMSKEDDEETPELITQSKQGTRRTVYKSVKAANSKDAGVSKEDDEETPEMITKSKQGTRKKVYKPKGKTPESCKKANDDDSSKPKSSSVNVNEPEDGDAAESAKGPTKGGSKSGKKRKRT